MRKRVEIVCSACGVDTLIRREPVYDGFKKSGESLTCVSCGHVYADEADVPFKQEVSSNLFSDADKPSKPAIFQDDERGGTCRHCSHYIVNPFAQRCGLHRRFVEATDSCPDFTATDPDSC